MTTETTKVSDLIRQGRHDEVWQRFCGFLDLTLPEFMAIQKQLLQDQLQLVGPSGLGRIVMGDDPPQDVEEFRQRVPLTAEVDYAPYLSEIREEVLAERPVIWAHDWAPSGLRWWVPYTARAYARIGEQMLTAIILATARHRGDVHLEPDDVFVWNVAARPYVTGYAALSLTELLDCRNVPSVEEMEKMAFQERIEAGFVMGLRTGIDVIGSFSSVLLKIGEQFAKSAGGTRFSPLLLHPATLLRLVRALVRSRLAGRPLLPKDLWQLKGMIVSATTDAAIYRDKLKEYWGVEPVEIYGWTEALGSMAVQTWSGYGLYFIPDTSFYEFVPEAEWARYRADPSYIPQTVLLDEVTVGQRYNVVITSFYGGPFLRYHTHDVVRFISVQDEEAGIELPSMIFAGRGADFIDFAGFTGLISEKLVWQAINHTGIAYDDWTIRK